MTSNLRISPVQLFSRNLKRLKDVQLIQNDLNEIDAHKLNRKIKYLNQSYIFHLVAYWQDFIQTLAEAKFSDVQSEQGEHKLNSVLERNVKNYLKRFNTPNTENIDSLFENVLGVSQITNCWNTSEFNRSEAKGRLKEILNSRHQIAHEGYAQRELNYNSNFEDMEFIYKLACLLQEKMDIYQP